MAARNYINGAPLLTLSVAVDTDDVTLQVSSTTGYPSVPFTLTLERGTVNEEVTLCTAKSGNTFTVTRGWDGTTGKNHAQTAPIEHTTTAADYQEANTHINSVGDVHSQYLLKSAWSAKGMLMAATGSGVPVGLAVGTNSYVLMPDSAQSSGVKWAQIVEASIADGAVSLAKLGTSLANSVIQRLTSGTMPGSPVQGQVVHQTDTVRWVGRDSTGWTPFATGTGKTTYSTSAASGGADGDVHLRYS